MYNTSSERKKNECEKQTIDGKQCEMHTIKESNKCEIQTRKGKIYV